MIKELGRAVPYGIYDLAANAGWVSVGMSHDTSASPAQTIRRWSQNIGCKRYLTPSVQRLPATVGAATAPVTGRRFVCASHSSIGSVCAPLFRSRGRTVWFELGSFIGLHIG
jgi:hypothetical protein